MMNREIDNMRTREVAREIHRTLRMVRARVISRHATIISSLTGKGEWPDLTLKQVHMLMTIRERGEVSIKELAECLFETPASASVMVDRLYEKGMVSREFDEIDRRKVVVALLSKAEQLIAKVEDEFIDSFVEVLQAIGSEYTEKLSDVCVRVRALFEGGL